MKKVKMSPTHSKKAQRDHSKSDQSFLEVTLFACGHGDTILVRLPGPKWILIDCNLRSNETKRRFFDLVAEQEIQRLDVLILTHPHYDHYVGMIEWKKRGLRLLSRDAAAILAIVVGSQQFARLGKGTRCGDDPPWTA